MMTAYKLPNGNFLDPKRAEGPGGIIGDGMVEVPPTDPSAQSWVAWYNKRGKDVPPLPPPRPRPQMPK